ncbi:hypothetical protein JB92DRAFT_2829984 [Gautieria morchelliformis]|nr:hypothetical protein JB92DRAFT_2829984 [Gautieria morchelliformis]
MQQSNRDTWRAVMAWIHSHGSGKERDPVARRPRSRDTFAVSLVWGMFGKYGARGCKGGKMDGIKVGTHYATGRKNQRRRNRAQVGLQNPRPERQDNRRREDKDTGGAATRIRFRRQSAQQEMRCTGSRGASQRKRARVEVVPVLGGCGIREHYYCFDRGIGALMSKESS